MIGNKIGNWQQKIGNQRDWIWHGWQTRYTFVRPQEQTSQTTPLILLHGFGASIGHWRHNLEILGQQHMVYALDMLGWGASEKAPINYSVDLWVDQVYDFWRTFIRQPVILIGNSLGSLVSLTAAAKYPQMVKGVIMMSLPDPSLEQEAIPPGLRPLVMGIKSIVASPFVLKPLFKILRKPSVVRNWVKLAYANPEAISDELVEILTAPPQDRGSARAFSGLFRATIGINLQQGAKAMLPNLCVPILLIWGEKDRFVPPAIAPQFTQYNSQLELLNLANVGHCPHDESPETVNQSILEWIESHFATTI